MVGLAKKTVTGMILPFQADVYRLSQALGENLK